MKKFEEEFDNLMRAFVEYHDCFDFDTEKYYLELKKEFIEKYGKKHQPEIPEFVAKYIEKYKGTRTVYGILDKISRNQKVYPKLYEWVFKNEERQEIFAQAWLNGYTVAKEKRFYLKHKSVLIFDPDSDDSDVDELYLGAGGNFVPYQHLARKFTQSEIDSMETGSYEQIEVEE